MFSAISILGQFFFDEFPYNYLSEIDEFSASFRNIYLAEIDEFATPNF